jgi:hypothetical protein
VRGGANVVPAVGGDFSLSQIEQEHTLRVLARASTREEAARISASILPHSGAG